MIYTLVACGVVIGFLLLFLVAACGVHHDQQELIATLKAEVRHSDAKRSAHIREHSRLHDQIADLEAALRTIRAQACDALETGSGEEPEKEDA